MSRSGMFGPAVCSLAVVCRVRSSAVQRSAHDSGCRLARGLDVHPYVSAPAVTGPKVQRHDGVLSARLVVRPMVRLVVARSMVRLVARPVYLRRSPAAPGP